MRLARARQILVVTALLVASASSGTLSAPSSPALAADGANPNAMDGIALTLAPDNGGVLQPGQDLAVTVRVSNSSDRTLPAAQIQLAVSSSRLSSPGRLDTWLNGSEFPVVLAQIATPTMAAGEATNVRAIVPAGTLPMRDWGAYGVVARMQTGAGAVPDARSAVVFASGASPRTTSVTTVVPLVAPSGTSGLLSADVLGQLLSSSGPLGRALESMSGRPVVFAVDPRIIASVRVLGSSAPSAATQWLQRLASSGNEIFPLQYADADPAVQRDSGIPYLLAPFSFDYAMNPNDFVGGSPSAVQPTAAPNGKLPTVDQILAWKYSATGIVWPDVDTVDESDLAYFASSGSGTTIVSSAQVSYSENDTAHSAPARIADHAVLIADRVLARGMTLALAGGSPADRDSGIALVSAMTAAMSTGSSAAPVTALAAVDRRWLDSVPLASSGFEVDAALDRQWSRPASLASLMSLPAALDATLQSRTEDPDRVAAVSRLLGNEIQVETFSRVIAQPALITGRVRNDFLATLAVRYRDDPQGWADAVGISTGRTNAILNGVQVVGGSSINLLSAAAEIPITISNDLRYPATVVVTVTPSNGRLVVDQTVQVTVEAESRTTARVPVTAGVANGEVTLTVRLLTPDGVPIAEGAPLTVNVSADWEGIGATALAVLVGGFFAFSVIRFVVIRRRRRSSPAPHADATRDGGLPVNSEDAS